jgi:hypothetical protein
MKYLLRAKLNDEIPIYLTVLNHLNYRLIFEKNRNFLLHFESCLFILHLCQKTVEEYANFQTTKQ